MDAKHINPFLTATINLFNSMLGSEPRVGQPSLLDDFHSHRWDISGVIGIIGAADGVVTLRLTESVVTKLVERSGLESGSERESYDIINSMVGEMVNVIAGNALSDIAQYDLNITVPIVVQGQNHSIAWPSNSPVMAVPFLCSAGPFEVNVSLKKNRLFSPS